MGRGTILNIPRWMIFALLALGLGCNQLDFAPSPASLALGTPAAVTASATSGGINQPAELAPYEIQGDVVLVNNRICAMSLSPMQEAQLGTHVTRVVYEGPLEKFHGKTLVFNQCCPMCVTEFPKKWAEERDQIMLYHGLT
jgi:hypothetical protein